MRKAITSNDLYTWAASEERGRKFYADEEREMRIVESYVGLDSSVKGMPSFLHVPRRQTAVKALTVVRF